MMVIPSTTGDYFKTPLEKYCHLEQVLENKYQTNNGRKNLRKYLPSFENATIPQLVIFQNGKVWPLFSFYY